MKKDTHPLELDFLVTEDPSRIPKWQEEELKSRLGYIPKPIFDDNPFVTQFDFSHLLFAHCLVTADESELREKIQEEQRHSLAEEEEE